MVDIPRRVRCYHCGHEWETTARRPQCAKCKGVKLAPLIEAPDAKPLKAETGADYLADGADEQIKIDVVSKPTEVLDVGEVKPVNVEALLRGTPEDSTPEETPEETPGTGMPGRINGQVIFVVVAAAGLALLVGYFLTTRRSSGSPAGVLEAEKEPPAVAPPEIESPYALRAYEMPPGFS